MNLASSSTTYVNAMYSLYNATNDSVLIIVFIASDYEKSTQVPHMNYIHNVLGIG